MARPRYTQDINDKMRVLAEFGICDKYDVNMRIKLERAISENPNKSPREVLDRYCRSMIQEKIMSWV